MIEFEKCGIVLFIEYFGDICIRMKNTKYNFTIVGN